MEKTRTIKRQKVTRSIPENKKDLVEPKHEGSQASSPAECLTQLLMSKEMADLTVIIPGHTEDFKVHRFVLSMWSPVFRAMMFGPMAEGDTITLEEDPAEAFSWLLNYMYAGQTELPQVEVALQVYLLANKYLMGHLKTVCSEYLVSKVNAVNAPEILNTATLLDNEVLINKCTEALQKSPDSFMSSPTIGTLNSDSLEQILKKDFPVTSEIVIYQGILKWGREHLKSKEQELNSITLRQEVDKFVPLIRFLSMSMDEFVKHVLADNILTLAEVEAISLSIAGVPEVIFPSQFSTINEKRRKFIISELNKCPIRHRNHIAGAGNVVTIANPDMLVNVKTNSIIYLSKLEYASDVGYKGTLTVKDSSGRELQTVPFNGLVAEFVPLQILPEETYTFSLSGGQSSNRYQYTYALNNNGIIFGHMVFNFITAFNLYYWK